MLDYDQIARLSYAELLAFVQNQIEKKFDELDGVSAKEVNVSNNLIVDGDISLSSTAIETLKRELGLS